MKTKIANILSKIKEMPKKNKIIAGVVVAVILFSGIGGGVYVYTLNTTPTQKEATKTEDKSDKDVSIAEVDTSTQIDEIEESVLGIRDLTIEVGAEVDLAEMIEYDENLVKEIKIDDSKVDYSKAGTYKVIYTIIPKDTSLENIELEVEVTVVTSDNAKKLVEAGEEVITKEGITNEAEAKSVTETTAEADKTESTTNNSTNNSSTSNNSTSSSSNSNSGSASNSSTGNSGSTSNGSSNSSSNSGSSNNSSASNKVWVEAVTKQVWIVDKSAWTEKVLVSEGYWK